MTDLVKNTSLLLGAALSLSMALPAFAQDTATETETPDAAAETMVAADANTVVATVNGEDITLGHVIAARLSLPQEYQALPNEVLFGGLIEQLIQQTVLAQSVAEMSRSSQVQIENEKRAIVATEALEGILATAVDDTAIQAYYTAEFSNAEPTYEWNASHILVDTEEEAQALVDELAAGADFAELAKEKSTGPTGPTGGLLDWFSPGMMVEPFEIAVSGMEVGAVSAPVKTQFGWHVIKLNDTRPVAVPELDAVRTDIVNALQAEAVDAALAEMEAAATIERTDVSGIDSAVLSDLTLLD